MSSPVEPQESATSPFELEPGPTIDLRLTLIMAATCGVAVANIYYNQPLLGVILSTFPETRSIAAMVPTATQLGYASGLLLLVPLGDRFDRRRLILIQISTLVLSLAATALAPNAWWLVASSVLVGMTSTVAQQVLPFAAELSAPERRGRTIGTVMSGLLCGILLSRALGGAVGEHFGWRAMYGLGLGLTALTGLVLAVVLPHSRPNTDQSYGALLRSLADLWREEPELRRSTSLQACLFGSFIAVWTVLALHLDTNYRLSATVAGLFGIVGASGVLFAPIAGKIADRRGPYAVIGLGTLLMSASWLILGLWNSVAGLVVGIVLIDFGVQGVMISNQHIIYALRPEARNRINTVYICGMFVGGAAGSAASSLAWSLGGWPAVCGFGGAAVTLALGFYLQARRARVPAAEEAV